MGEYSPFISVIRKVIKSRGAGSGLSILIKGVYSAIIILNFTSSGNSSGWGSVGPSLLIALDGKVEYETSHRITLYDRDFLGLEWGAINLQKPTNLTAYCLLDRNYEYKLYDIVAKGYNPYSRFVPVNHKLLPDADFLPTTKKAVMILMENSLGTGENANGKESLFKCLPEKGVVAERYWENETTRMLMLHRLPDEEGLAEESYYLHIEPK